MLKGLIIKIEKKWIVMPHYSIKLYNIVALHSFLPFPQASESSLVFQQSLLHGIVLNEL